MTGFALERSKGELTGRERARFLKDVAKSLKDKDREQLSKLREQIAKVKKRRRSALALVRAKCRNLRAGVRQRVAAYRAQERERVNAEVERMRNHARELCELRKRAVQSAGGKVERKARQELTAERMLQRDLKTAAQWEKRTLKATKRQVQAESDDEVRGNIDPELVPVFEKVKRSIKGSDRISRTEAFLQWLEENPGDAVAIQQQVADVELKRLLREQRQAETEAKRRRARRYKPTKAELAAALAEVPF